MAAGWRDGKDTPSHDDADGDLTIIDPFDHRPAGGFVTAEPPRSARPLVAAVLGVLALIGAIVLLGGEDGDESSADDPATDEPETANDSAVDETDEPEAADTRDPLAPDEFNVVVDGELDLEQIATTLPGVVFAAHEINGSLFTLVADDLPFGLAWSTLASELTMHVRRPDGEWVDQGLVLEGAAIYATAPAPDAFLAVGVDADGAPTLWSTTDGVDWSAETLPVASAEPHIPAQVAATAETVLVRSAPLDPWTRFVQALAEADVELGRFGPEFRDESTLIVRGPLGIPIDAIDLDELGIESPFDAMFDIEGNPNTVWVGDGDDWVISEESFWDAQGGVFALTDGRFLRLTGTTVEWSDDALTWQPAARGLGVWRATPWGDRVVTLSSPNGFQIRSSDLRIEAQGPLPTDAFVEATGAGPAGIAYVAQTAEQSTAASDVLIRRDGVVARFDADLRVVLETDGVEVADWSINDLQFGDERVEIDREAGVVSFLDPENGQRLIDARFDELEQIEAALDPLGAATVRVLYSPDGRTWTSNELTIADPQPFASALPHVGTNALVVFTRDVGAAESLTSIHEADLAAHE